MISPLDAATLRYALSQFKDIGGGRIAIQKPPLVPITG